MSFVFYQAYASIAFCVCSYKVLRSLEGPLKMIRAISSFIAIASAVSAQTSTSAPPSPCPDVFMYEPLSAADKANSGTLKWYGTINLTTDITLYALWLNIILDSKADILGNWVGEVTTEDNHNFKIENTKMKIDANSTLPVRFFIQYNSRDNVPRLQSILFNGREICNADSAETVVPSSISQSNNYDINNRTPARVDRTTTTVRPITTTKARNQYGEQTTTKANYWSQSKTTTTTTTTEKITSNIWNTQVKPVSSQQPKKEQTQTTFGSSTQSKNQWSQSKSQNSQQAVTSTTQNQNQAQTKQQSGQWTQTKTTNYPQIKSEKLQVTTQRPSQVSYTKPQSTTDSTKFQSWSQTKVGNPGQIKVDNKQSNQASYSSYQTTTENTYNTQVWAQTKVENNQPIKTTNTQTRNDERYQVVTSNQYYSQPNAENDQQNKAQNGPEYIGSSYDLEENTQQRKPVVVSNTDLYNIPVQKKVSTEAFQARPEESFGRRPVDALPIRDDSIVQVRPTKAKATTTTPPRLFETYSYVDNRNANERDEVTDRNVQTVFSGQQLPAPIVGEYYTDDSARDDDEEDDGFGLPVYIPHLRPETACGKVTVKPPRVLPYGSTTSEGQWPWQVALYQQQTVDFKYICGGTLVSPRHIITAAHCVTKRNSKKQVNQNTLTVYLGKFNLRTSVEGVQVKFVKKIIIHPEYNATIFSRDVAILELRDAATFTNWVRPACLWPENKIGRRNIVGKKGSIVGWGFEISGAPRAELSHIEMAVVDQETCISSFEDFYQKFTSEYTYCAGYIDGTSICNGDSGGGMVFKRGSTWYLRGLVSISVARPHERCDLNRYVIFTDLAKFLPWIEEHVD